jgi:sulfite reductase beta subunit-like hemoprotein
MATIEAILRTFDHYGNRDNKLRARMKWLVDTMGWEELQARILKERKMLLASSTWPGGIPEIVQKLGDEPAGVSTSIDPTPVGTPVRFLGLRKVDVLLERDGMYKRWESANVVRGVAKGTVSAYAYAPLGDITSAQFRSLAAIQRELGADVRVTNRQNVVFRGLTESQVPTLYQRLIEIDMAEPGAELARDVVSCPGADTCNLAVTQSRGLADNIGKALEDAGLADVGGIRINISGCTNSCGQHHIADIGFLGVERRAHGKSAPGYQMQLGGRVGQQQVEFGEKAMRLPAKRVGEATVAVVGRYAAERNPGEAFGSWLDRVGGAKTIGAELKELDVFPLPEEGPEFYVDYDETGPYVVETGESECAT